MSLDIRGDLKIMNEAKHDDKEKLALQWILSMPGIDDVSKVGEYGAKKYGQSNWRGGSEWMRYAGSCVRHLTSFIRGDILDSESGLPHLAHCAYNCLILLTWAKEGTGQDDRHKNVTDIGTRPRVSIDICALCGRAHPCRCDLYDGADCEVIE